MGWDRVARSKTEKKATENISGWAWARQIAGRTGTQPPFLERLPGFFLLRVATPRSRLTR